jgi:hypothetical protein
MGVNGGSFLYPMNIARSVFLALAFLGPVATGHGTTPKDVELFPAADAARKGVSGQRARPSMTQVPKDELQQEASSQPQREPQAKRKEYVWPADKHNAQVAARDAWMKESTTILMENMMALPPNERSSYESAAFKTLKEMAPEFPREFGNRFPEIMELVRDSLKKSIYYSGAVISLDGILSIFNQANPDPKSISPSEHVEMQAREALFWLESPNLSFGPDNPFSNQQRIYLISLLTPKNKLSDLLKSHDEVRRDSISEFKKIIKEVRNSMVDSNNRLFNDLARNSSPEFAASCVFGLGHEPIHGGTPVTPRVSRESGPDVEKAKALAAQQKEALQPNSVDPATPTPSATAPEDPAAAARKVYGNTIWKVIK